MRVLSLASGSKGNCYYVETDETCLLIDCGLSYREIKQKLTGFNIDIKNISFLLLTHIHSDHTKGFLTLIKNLKNLKVFCERTTANGLYKLYGDTVIKHINIITDGEFFLNELMISACTTPHDAHCYNYAFYKNGENVFSILTDCGEIQNSIIENVKNAKLLFLESNHNEEMVRINPNYSYQLKQRILGSHGHLSNKNAGKFLNNFLAGCREIKLKPQVVLIHLSENNNTEETALANVYAEIDGKIFIKDKDYTLCCVNQWESTEFFID